MNKPWVPGMAQNPFVNARRGEISAGSNPMAASRIKKACLYCCKDFTVVMPRQRFCSNRCRLLYWAAGEIMNDYRSGRAKGLREVVKRLKL
jgi:endogenous inhibitor of DNA gyrase (YacG/DUF329 family)